MRKAFQPSSRVLNVAAKLLLNLVISTSFLVVWLGLPVLWVLRLVYLASRHHSPAKLLYPFLLMLFVYSIPLVLLATFVHALPIARSPSSCSPEDL